MTRYEYQRGKSQRLTQIMDIANAMGDVGWRLVTLQKAIDQALNVETWVAVFERPLPDAPTEVKPISTGE